MHFRVIDERPTATPHGGASRLLLGFAALSVLIHGLLLVPGGEAPLRLQPLGTPYIRAILSTGQTPAGREKAAGSGAPSKERATVPATRRATQAAPAHNDGKAPIRQRQAKPAQTPASTSPRPASRPQGRHSVPTASESASGKDITEAKTASTSSQAKPGGEGSAKTGADARRNFLLGQLQDQLSRYLNYPLRARRRGWEGEVLLGLHLAADGRLSDIRLLRSSGHTALDRSALQALVRLGRLHLPADVPTLQPTELHLPVVFRLSES